MVTNTTTSHEATWSEVQSLLRRASERICPVRNAAGRPQAESSYLGGSMDEFSEFVSHNEFELAWDALAAVADKVQVPPEFWDELAEAALLMELPRKRRDAEKRATAEREDLIATAFRDTREGGSTDLVVADPVRNRRFLQRCRELGLCGTDFAMNWLLFNSRKAGKLWGISDTRRYTIPVARRADFEFASEIAVRFVQREHQDPSLDKIICDPELVRLFDSTASRLAPGFTQLEYRWAAFGLRKSRSLPREPRSLEMPEFCTVGPITAIRPEGIPETGGVYLLKSRTQSLFVGETLNLRHRMETHLRAGHGAIPSWLYPSSGPIILDFAELADTKAATRRSVELAAILAFQPLFNYVHSVSQAA